MFTEKTDALYNDKITYFKKGATNLVLENSGWGEQVQIHLNELDL